MKPYEHPWWMTELKKNSERIHDQTLERYEREDANKRIREWRCEELFRTLVNLGLTRESARQIAEGVWEEKVSWISLKCAGPQARRVSTGERKSLRAATGVREKVVVCTVE